MYEIVFATKIHFSISECVFKVDGQFCEKKYPRPNEL